MFYLVSVTNIVAHFFGGKMKHQIFGKCIPAIMQRMPPPPTCSIVSTSHSIKSTNFFNVIRFSGDKRRDARQLIASNGFNRILDFNSMQFPPKDITSSKLKWIEVLPLEFKVSSTVLRSCVEIMRVIERIIVSIRGSVVLAILSNYLIVGLIFCRFF